MPDVVTFDPVALRIVEIDTGGDSELSVQEVYSEWKDWLLADPARLGYPTAFRYVGADPISQTQNLGTTYFLTNGWRIRPAERTHRVRLVGNLFTDPAGDSPVVPTLGAFAIVTEYSVSNLVDTAVVTTPGGGLTSYQEQCLYEMYALYGLDPLRPLVVSPTERKAPEDGSYVRQTIVEAGGVVTVRRQ